MKRILIKSWTNTAIVLVVLLIMQPLIFLVKLPQDLRLFIMLSSGVLALWLLLSLIDGINYLWKIFLKRAPLINYIIENKRLNALISNYLGLIIATLYCIYTFSVGVIYESAWFVTQAFYYLLLFIIRLILGHKIRTSKRRSLTDRWKTYRTIGRLLLLFTLTLSGMMILILHQKDVTSNFSQNILLIVALYTFVNLGSVIRGFAKSRRYESLLLKADKDVVMVTALISLYNLQTLMLDVYSSDPAYVRLMTISTGLAIIGIVIGLAGWMLIESHLALKKIHDVAD
ncbi:hypothetical protein [Limosilactobacillus allomucosae]|uniref:hypothetical protein n=1 Tax=Limosilactobacillus allomucosae TaxID=3142938 RepID=UPI003266CAFB